MCGKQLTKHPLTEAQKEAIAHLCLLPRTWMSRSISVTYELRGIQMYEQFQQALDMIKVMEKKHKHPLLSRLKKMFSDSVSTRRSTYEDLQKAHDFVGQLTDILYGEKQKSKRQKECIRKSEEHRQQYTVSQIKQQVEQLIDDFEQNNKERSPLCRKFIRHFQTTYENWNEHIFTCYEYDFIPNDNNALESYHNVVKRAIRKTTGHKRTSRFLLVHGEDFILSQAFHDKSTDDFLHELARVDFECVTKRQQQLKAQQKKRGLKIIAVKHTEKLLQKAYDNW